MAAVIIIIELDFLIMRDVILFCFHPYSRPVTNMLSKSKNKANELKRQVFSQLDNC